MMTYRDRWWCTKWERCIHGATCDRALTPAVDAEAHEWMGKWTMFDVHPDPECFVARPADA